MSDRRWWRVVPFALIAFLAGAELAARLDDWLRFDVSLLTTPNATYDLILVDSTIIRGRPFGRFLKIRLNAAGFRGAPITPADPPPGCLRVMVLGASESVVGGDAAGTEYSAFMQRALAPHGCFDVQNAAISALHLARITSLWAAWGRHWGARLAIVYPSPAFYLGADPPEYQTRPLTPLVKPPWWASRALQRWSDQSLLPDWVTAWQLRRYIAHKRRSHWRGWEFRKLPEDRLALYRQHLDSLVSAIQATGAEPILVTHAMRFSDPPAPEDELMLLSWQRDSRATGPVILEFERAANAALEEEGRKRGVMVVDAAALMNGRREWYTDFSHFTPEGRAVLGSLLADSVRSLVSRRLATALSTGGRGVESFDTAR